MYDKHLKAFIITADCGSFLKASEKMYISANALTKQINLLEDRLKVRLFIRSHQGLQLTDAGKLIYTEAKKMIRHSDKVIKRARELEEKETVQTIKVGVSLMNPASVFLRYWNSVSSPHPDLHFEVIPYEDTVPAFQDVLDHLGDTIDIIACPYQTNFWGDRYQSFHLFNLPVCMTFSSSHSLNQKKALSIYDLKGNTILLARRGLSTYQDQIRNNLEKEKGIYIKDVDYVDIHTFNQLADSDDMILSSPCWAGVHPLLTTKLLDIPFTVPYGIIYSPEPSSAVQSLLDALQKLDHTSFLLNEL